MNPQLTALLAMLASLNASEKAALAASLGFSVPAAGGGSPASFKFSPAIDAIDAGEVDNCIKSLAECLSKSTETEMFSAVATSLESRYPALVAAARANSTKRGKTLAHSLDVALKRLTLRKEAKPADAVTIREQGEQIDDLQKQLVELRLASMTAVQNAVDEARGEVVRQLAVLRKETDEAAASKKKLDEALAAHVSKVAAEATRANLVDNGTPMGDAADTK